MLSSCLLSKYNQEDFMPFCDICGQRMTEPSYICRPCQEELDSPDQKKLCLVRNCQVTRGQKSPYCSKHRVITDVLGRLVQSQNNLIKSCRESVKDALVNTNQSTRYQYRKLGEIGIVDGAYNKADITCRSLLLGATGDTPTPKDGKGNYMRLFGLNDDRLHGMRGQTLADFGCGASFFCAEIAVLYQVDAMGVDLMSANEFAQYSRESTARYATSMYVLYGRKKIESKHGTEMKLIEKIIDHMDQIIETYGEGGWLQTGKDIFDPDSLPKAREISVSSNMLGYFEGETQKTAIDNILSKTKSQAYLAASDTLKPLNYRWNELTDWQVEKVEERLVVLRRKSKSSFLSKIGLRKK
jgi:hypothetical protein